MSERYKVINKSVSNHCCFGYTVVDTHRPVIIGGKPFVGSDGEARYETMCECFDDEEAIKIAGALNGVNSDES